MSDLNESGYKPTTFRVIVKMDKVQEKTEGGIILPTEVIDTKQFAKSEGTLVDKGYCAFVDKENQLWPEKPEIGNRVAFKAYGGLNINGKDGELYRVLNDEEIFAIIQ